MQFALKAMPDNVEYASQPVYWNIILPKPNSSIQNDPAIEIIRYRNAHILLPRANQSLAMSITSDWFNVEFWQAQNAISGQSVGRNITWFLNPKICNIDYTQEWVLRHYYRGGLVAKLIKDHYWFTRLGNTRAFQELKLLQHMYSQGLPVPKPIAARVIRKGLFYRADLLIEKIANAQDLVALLKHSALSQNQWELLGQLIAQFHHAGIYHADLNAHNILLDDHTKFYLIDFDKCKQQKHQSAWCDANLQRLKRSLYKEQGLTPRFHFNDIQWVWLENGYNNFSANTDR